MNWETLLRKLRDHGYAGPDTLDGVKTYIKQNNLELKFDGIPFTEHDLSRSRKAFEKARMAGDVRATDSGGVVIELEPDGEAEGDYDEDQKTDDEDPAEQKARKYAAAKTIKRLTDRIQTLEDQVDRAKAAAIQVELPGASKWRAQKRSGKTVFETPEKARDFGNFWLASSPYVAANYPAMAEKGRKGWGERRGEKANSTFPNIDGGALVSPEFSADIINYQDSFGDARRMLRNIPMGADRISFPRYNGGVAAAWVSEGDSIDESDGEFNSISLVAKKLAAYTAISNELMGDSAIAIGEFIASEMARQAAKKEDIALFQGDGTSAYGGIVGLEGKMGAYSGSDDRHVQASNTSSTSDSLGFTRANLATAKGKIRRVHRDSNLAWVTSAFGQAAIFGNLAQEAGGITYRESLDGSAYVPVIMGLPVYTVGEDIIDTSTSAGTIVAYCVNLYNAGSFGDRNTTDIQTSSDYLFKSDQIAVRMTERVDINLHDVGTASAADTVVALYTK